MHYSNNNSLSNIIAISNVRYGLYLTSSSNNILSDIIATSSQGLYLYLSSNNSLSNITTTSNTSNGLIVSSSSNNTLSNITATSNTSQGLYLTSSSNNTLSNITATSNDNFGIYLNSALNNNLSNAIITSNGNTPVVYFNSSCRNNTISNSKFVSLNKENTLMYIGSNSFFNTFYGNNFTNTSGYYVEDLNGSNYYNTTISEKGEGNIWYEITNNSLDITGNTPSTLYPSLYIGESGANYPYNVTNSLGKISGNIVDYSPLINPYQESSNDPSNEETENNPQSGGGTKIQTKYNYQLDREFYESGEQFKMRINSYISFKYKEEIHKLTLNSFNSESAKITIQSTLIIATLKKDIPQSFDIDGDLVQDIEVLYGGVEGADKLIFVSKLSLVDQVPTEDSLDSENIGDDVDNDKTKPLLLIVLISLIIACIIIVGYYVFRMIKRKKRWGKY
jgi:parallel beta-helix repeat protein